MGNKKTVLPGTGLGIRPSSLIRIEGCFPVSVRAFSPEETAGTVEDIDIITGTPGKTSGDVLFTQCLCHPGNTPIVISKFQQTRNRFLTEICRNIALPDVIISSFGIFFSRPYHRFQGFPTIETANSFHPGICDDRDGVISDHSTRFS